MGVEALDRSGADGVGRRSTAAGAAWFAQRELSFEGSDGGWRW
jgi:hypothetical protein